MITVDVDPDKLQVSRLAGQSIQSMEDSNEDSKTFMIDRCTREVQKDRDHTRLKEPHTVRAYKEQSAALSVWEDTLYANRMAVTMKDIAQDIGVSIITVSKVLRGHTDIGPETRRRVLERAKELNYKPNLAARTLVTGRSSLVGLVVPDLLHPFFVEIANSLARELKSKGLYLIIASSEENPSMEDETIEHLLAHRLDALVVSSCAAQASDLLQRIRQQGTPLILLDRSFKNFKAHFVGSDNVEMGCLATKHLLSLGRKRVAHIRGPENSIGRGRMEGYRAALDSRGIRVREQLIVSTSTVDVDSARQGQHAMEKLLALKPRPDAVFCYSDPIAIGAMQTILSAGLKIPGDIAVIGCGNLHYDGFLQVPLSSVDQRSGALGEKTAKLLLSLLKKRDGSKQNSKAVTVESSLIVRQSTHALS